LYPYPCSMFIRQIVCASNHLSIYTTGLSTQAIGPPVHPQYVRATCRFHPCPIVAIETTHCDAVLHSNHNRVPPRLPIDLASDAAQRSLLLPTTLSTTSSAISLSTSTSICAYTPTALLTHLSNPLNILSPVLTTTTFFKPAHSSNQCNSPSYSLRHHSWYISTFSVLMLSAMGEGMVMMKLSMSPK
jgi:hypothetical protein